MKLKEFATINMGQSPKGETYNTNGNGMPFLQGRKTFGRIYPTIDTWSTNPIKIANKDEILHRAAHTPTEMYKRTAYLMWALFDFDDKKIKNCCELAELVAEYQYRQYINLTYAEQKEEKKKRQQKLPPTTQQTQENFNK